MNLKHFEKLSNNYLELLNDDEDFNVIINVGESPNIKSFKAHSAILRYRSLYFHDKLANIIQDNNNIKTINLKNILTEHFEFLHDELAKNLETYLIESKSSWLRLHFTRVCQKSFQNDKLHEFQKWCNDIIVKYPDKFFSSEDFTSIKENALVSIIKRDDLQMSEVKVWKHVIRWGIAQNSDHPSNLKNWTNENFLTLKNTLKN
ncbi:hypothetical protein C2G38_2236641, partial [Gigaspora rosea]